MPGARCTRSLAWKMKTRELVTTVTPETSGIPRATVLTISFVLSLVIGLCCHHTPRDAKASSRADASVEASGPHDFVVRERPRSSVARLASIAPRAQRS